MNKPFQFLSRCALTGLVRSVIAVSALVMTGCSFFQDREEHVVDKSDPQYLELKAMLEQQKIEWEAQKPALKRLVENEDELALLVEILSKMSVIGDAESLENFMLENQIDAKEKNKGIALKSDESSQQPNYKNRNNPLTPLADSPEELQHLMTELQKVARTQRYLALREQKKRDAMKENAPEIDAATPSYGGIFANSKVQINDYAQQMAGKLAKFSSLEGASVGVASFVKFDDTLRNSTSLGNQFAEAVATELPRFGVSVVDFKLTKQIEVSSRGDLSLTREGEKLIGKTDMEYILTGTLVVTSRGVQINSRVVSVDTRNVIAAASTFLPKEVLQQIQP